MVCDIVEMKEVFTRSLKRAEKLKETVSKTREGEFLDNTIMVAKRSLKLLSERNFDALRTLAKEELIADIATVSMMEKLGGEILASIGKNPRENSPKEKFTFKSAKHIFSRKDGDMLEVKVTSGVNNDNWGTYTFKKGHSRSTPTVANGNIMLSAKLGQIIDSTINTVNGVNTDLNRSNYAKAGNAGIAKARAINSSSSTTEELLKNSENLTESDFDYTRASKLGDYNHGNIDHMRNVLADLHAIGGKPTTDTQYDYYNDLLGKMHPHFFRDMDLYITDNEETAHGWVDIEKNSIVINATSNTDSGMSNAEVYMHEVIHTVTTWAIKSKSNKASDLKSRLNYLRSKAVASITWKDLMNADNKLSVKGAKARYDYIFHSKNADDEFVAFALTNPALMGLLSKVKIKDEREGGLFNSIKNFFSDLMDAVMGNYAFANRNSDVMTEMHTLAAAFSEINQKADVELETNANMFTKAKDMVENAESFLEEVVLSITENLDKKGNVPVSRDMSHVQKIMFYAKFFAKSIYNSQYRHSIGRFLTDYGVGAQSSVREIARSVLPGVHDHLTTGAEFLGLQMSNVDRIRNTRVSNTEQSIVDGFSKTLVKEEEEALTSVILESNGQTLFTKDKNLGKGYSIATIQKLLTDKMYREKSIRMLKRRIIKNSKDRGNWIVGQAEGLGVYMATGKGHKAQNSNSSNIVRGYLSNTRHEDNAELLSMVEELASLTAISREKTVNSLLVSNLLKSEESGVKNIVNLYGAFISESKNLLFKGDSSHITEGYIKELYDDKIETAYAVMSKQEEMESQGFALKAEFKSDDNSGAENIGFFVSDTYTRPERLSGAIALGNPNSRGMTLKDTRYAQFHDSKKHAQVWFEADKLNYDAAAIKINKQLEDGVPLSEIEEGAVPILDASGVAVDYRNMMPKKDKAVFLKQNRKITDVLSKTMGSVVYKDAKAAHNDKVTEYIKTQIKEVYDNPNSKDNLLEMTLIGPDHIDPEIRKLYYQLPSSLQKLAAAREDKSLPIPDMLMDMYFGYSHLRATDLPGIKSLPNVIKRVLNMIEQVFMDIVKIAKGNILLKMPAVLVVNIVSNVLFAVSTGTNPFELIGDYARSIKDVHRFMQKQKKLEAENVELEAFTQSYYTTKFDTKEELDNYNDDVKRLKDSIKRLKTEMSDNPVKELFDLGMYQAVIEDVNMYKLGETNSVTDALNNVNNKFPAVISTPLNWLFLTKETAWYQANQYVLQMSDLVARDVMNRKQKSIEIRQADGKMNLPYEYRKETDRLKKGSKKRVRLGVEERKVFLAEAKKVRHVNLLRYFINYNLPNGKGEEYLNRIGVLMFTKYVKRIQRVISETGTKHPINTAVTLLAAGFALDLEMIQDQSFFVKGGDDYGVFGLTPIHNLVDVLMTVVNPPLIRLNEDLLGAKQF
jgi:hypothetical protein